MDWLLRFISFLIKTLFYQYTFRRVKRSGLLVYLKALQLIRKSLLLMVFLFFFFQMMIFGMIGMIVFGVWLWPTQDLELKLWVLFGISSFLFLLPVAGLLFAFSDRVWFKLSGAQKLVSNDQFE